MLYPDWSKAIGWSFNVPIQEDGYCRVHCNSIDGTCGIYLNGQTVAYTNGWDSYDFSTGIYPVKDGDIFTYSYSTSRCGMSLLFLPFKR